MSVEQFLPPELVFAHILPKLPPESLLRFKAVSKSWQSEINDPDFVTGYRPTLVFIDERRHQFGVVEGVRTQNPTVRKFPTAPFPSKRRGDPRRRVKIIGCCNGLVAIQEEPSCEVAIWNPYSRSYQKVPGSKDAKVPGIHLGFGYDSSHDDYKIVLIYGGFRVFSARTNSWGPVKELAEELRFELFISSGRDNCVTVGNTLHWTAAKRLGAGMSKELVLIAFDLSAENCRGIKLPGNGRGPARVTLANLHGMLCVIHDHEYRFDVWMMSPNGFTSSWTLAHRAMLPSFLRSVSSTFRLLVFPEDGVRVLLEFDGVRANKYVWFDMTNSSFEEVPALDIPVGSEACALMKCLVQTHWAITNSSNSDEILEDSEPHKTSFFRPLLSSLFSSLAP